MYKITAVPVPKRIKWNKHMVRTLVSLETGGMVIAAGTIMKVETIGNKRCLVGQPCKCCNHAPVYPILSREILSSVEFVVEERLREPVNNNIAIDVGSMCSGEYYRVTYGGTFMIGRFKKTNHVNLFWHTPYYHKWNEHESLKNNDWTVLSGIQSIQVASEEDLQRYNDMVVASKVRDELAS